MYFTAAVRDASDPVPPSDLAAGCTYAGEHCAGRLADAVPGATLRVKVRLIAALATVTAVAPNDVRRAAESCSPADGESFRAALCLTLSLVDGTVAEAGLALFAAMDEYIADFLESTSEWPLTTRAIDVVRELRDLASRED